MHSFLGMRHYLHEVINTFFDNTVVRFGEFAIVQEWQISAVIGGRLSTGKEMRDNPRELSVPRTFQSSYLSLQYVVYLHLYSSRSRPFVGDGVCSFGRTHQSWRRCYADRQFSSHYRCCIPSGSVAPYSDGDSMPHAHTSQRMWGLSSDVAVRLLAGI